MKILNPLQAVALACLALTCSPNASADQYRYQTDGEDFVISNERPEAGVPYAVLDDAGNFLHFVYDTASIVPLATWQPQVLDSADSGFADFTPAPVPSVTIEALGTNHQ